MQFDPAIVADEVVPNRRQDTTASPSLAGGTSDDIHMAFGG